MSPEIWKHNVWLDLPDPVIAGVRESDLGDEALYLAWEISRIPKGWTREQRRSLVYLVLAVLDEQTRGSTRLPANGPELAQVLAALGVSTRDIEASAALLDGPNDVVGRKEDFRPLILEDGFIYTQRLRQSEVELVGRLAARLTQSPPERARLAEAIEDVSRQPPRVGGQRLRWSDAQRLAVERAAQRPLTLISGGPGTGKTSIVVSILRVLARLGVGMREVALSAPTGKAAHRLEESITQQLAELTSEPDETARSLLRPPETLHRLLGFSPRVGRFRFNERNQLAERVVIVDECSMIDLFMMDRLVRALRPDGQLILIGDADQLPSVEAGAVFRDLVALGVERGAPWNIRLTESYRMRADDPSGRQILQAAQAVNRGEASDVLDETSARQEDTRLSMRRSTAEVSFEGAEFLPLAGPRAASVRLEFLDRWFSEQIARPAFLEAGAHTYFISAQRESFQDLDVESIRALLAHYEGRRLLCITRGDEAATGAESVNRIMHDKLLEHRRSQVETFERDAEFLPGEPVMMQHNDYHRELFNGDQGVVLRVSTRGQTGPMVVFPRREGFVSFPLESIKSELRLSYAMTVHKSQGSEFDHVGLILPDDDVAILTREILYTAMTRARRSVTVVAHKGRFEVGASRSVDRFSGVLDRFRAVMGDSDHAPPGA